MTDGFEESDVVRRSVWLTHAAEIWSDGSDGGGAGPTGDFAEVESGRVQDAGGNVLFSGTADECLAEKQKWKIFTRLVPTKWARVKGDVAGCDCLWQLVVLHIEKATAP